jgi:hypothetical protein
MTISTKSVEKMKSLISGNFKVSSNRYLAFSQYQTDVNLKSEDFAKVEIGSKILGGMS